MNLILQQEAMMDSNVTSSHMTNIQYLAGVAGSDGAE